MKQWMKQAVVCAPIDQVWTLADGSIEQLQKIVPAAVEFSPTNKTTDADVSVYRFKYEDNKQINACDVQLLDYADRSVYKGVKILFEYKKTYEITVNFQIYRVDDHHTNVRCTLTKVAQNRWAGWFLKFETDKYIHDLMIRVQQVFTHDNLSLIDEIEFDKSS